MQDKDGLSEMTSVETLMKMFGQQPETVDLGGDKLPSQSVDQLVDETLRKLLAQETISTQQLTLLDILFRNRRNTGE